MIRLDGCRRALQDRPVDGEVALDEGFLQQRGEVEALRVARLCAAPEDGEPFVFGGARLREKVAEETLGCATDLLRGFGEAKDGCRKPP